MTYNILKIMTNDKGKKLNVLMLDGLSSILEIDDKNKAIKFAKMLNENSDSNWAYEVRGCGKTIPLTD
jgi:archaellum biogenesis ATPase FlaH